MAPASTLTLPEEIENGTLPARVAAPLAPLAEMARPPMLLRVRPAKSWIVSVGLPVAASASVPSVPLPRPAPRSSVEVTLAAMVMFGSE